MSASDHLSGQQFRFVTGANPEKGAGQNSRRTAMFRGAEKEPVAHVDFDYENNQVEVQWLHSKEERQGHATRLMEHVYSQHPDMNIDWGWTNKKSTGLAEKFATTHYGRTTYAEDLNAD